MKTACDTKSIHICRLTKENKCGYFSQSPGNKNRCLYWKIGWNCHNNEAWPENRFKKQTRQICNRCQEPTGYCEEDGYQDDAGNDYCSKCATEIGLREDE